MHHHHKKKELLYSHWVPDQNEIMIITDHLHKLALKPHLIAENAKKLSFYTHPHCCYNLTFILTQLEEFETERKVASSLLLSLLPTKWKKLGVQLRAFIKSCLLGVLGEPLNSVRQGVCDLVCLIAKEEKEKWWPELIPTLYHQLHENQNAAHDSCVRILLSLYNFHLDLFFMEPFPPSFPPTLLHLLNSPFDFIRANTLSLLTVFVRESPSFIINFLPSFLFSLHSLCRDPSSGVRAGVFKTISFLSPPHYPQKNNALYPFFPSLLSSYRQGTALECNEACKCLSSLSKIPSLSSSFVPLPTDLLPTLLLRLQFNESQLRVWEGGQSGERETIDEIENKIRPSSGELLSSLISNFGADVFDSLFILIKQRLEAKDNYWWEKESAFKAIGHIPSHSISLLEPHLSYLFPHILSLLTQNQQNIRQTGCWVLSNLSKLILQPTNHSFIPSYFQYMFTLAKDNDPYLRVCASDAIATIFENSTVCASGNSLANMISNSFVSKVPDCLLPYLEGSVSALGSVVDSDSGHLNSILVSLRVFVSAVGSALSDPLLISLLAPPLINKWTELDSIKVVESKNETEEEKELREQEERDNSESFYFLMNCLTAFTIAIKTNFIPFIPPLFSKSVKLLKKACRKKNGAHEKEVMAACDMLAEIAKVVGGEEMGRMMEKEKVLKVIARLIEKEGEGEGEGERRKGKTKAKISTEAQSGLAGFLGELGLVLPSPIFSPILPSLLHYLCSHIKFSFSPMCNNCVWTLGIIATKCSKEELSGYVTPELVNTLVRILNQKNLDQKRVAKDVEKEEEEVADPSSTTAIDKEEKIEEKASITPIEVRESENEESTKEGSQPEEKQEKEEENEKGEKRGEEEADDEVTMEGMDVNLFEYNRSTILESSAITLGQLGLSNSEIVAPFLEIFARAWCAQIRDRGGPRCLKEQETDTALRGMRCILQVANCSPEVQQDVIDALSYVSE